MFICVFVLLSSYAAFCSDEFFNANLADLDQLNKVFPFIMLIFIPAITMGIWAEERREGTDELLLTIPAQDLDIVLGKYLAAVAIFTVSLLFSLVSNYLVFISFLGDPDVGLFVGTYVGYWMVGLAMLAIGMVDRVIPAGELTARALETAGTLGRFPARAFGMIKRNRIEAVVERIERNLEERENYFIECWFSEETRVRLKEAMETF